MSAATFHWPETGRLETLGTFANNPSPTDRGAVAGVGDRYRRGELVGAMRHVILERDGRKCRCCGTRNALLQSGEALKAASRRNRRGTMTAELDKAIFPGASGQPLGVIPCATIYGIATGAIDGPADWAAFRAAIMRFMTANTTTGPSGTPLAKPC
ncbi:hypothetical protein [Rhodobacter sp. 24-YEA-8]|uniref:hypothetical protein n=1 Tax=Rhodobacter sp. 24-YEA-8 TaxID=1884310 RepID=UPI00209B628F|nr:hypothetical protein [Rhodobacter sp. 24-YEA-8]